MTTILIVDDRPETLQTLESRLQNRGFVVVAASNGNEALAACVAQEINAVLMDMNMPEMDGCEATEFLKSQDATRSMPIIMCSAHPLPGDEARAVAAGCDGFMEKPISLKQFLELLGQLLQRTFDLDETEDPLADHAQQTSIRETTISHAAEPMPKPSHSGDRQMAVANDLPPLATES
jgi:two-component system, cell cycle response regulator DivK